MNSLFVEVRFFDWEVESYNFLVLLMNPFIVSLLVRSSTFIKHGVANMLKIKEKTIRKSIFKTCRKKVFFLSTKKWQGCLVLE